MYHPKNGKTVAVPATNPFFVAYGRGNGKVRSVKGTLSQGGEKPKPGKTLRDPERWMILFDADSFTLNERADYALVVKDPEGNVVAQATFKVSKARPVGITYPSEGDFVCQDNLVTYGTSTDSYPLKATLSITGQSDVTVDQVQGPPNWVIQFTNLPGTGSASLHVFDTDTPPNTSDVSDLNVVTCVPPF
jgi:hypothetical protein